MNVLYHRGKANVVDVALNRLYIGGVVPIEKEKKELVKDVHRLALLGLCVIVLSGSKSSFLAKVKEK